MQFPGAIAHEAWALMGVLARETSRVRIGTAVTAITFRHPVLLAMSIDGRSRLRRRPRARRWRGGGPKGYDAMGFAWSASERGERLERQLAMLDALLRGETVSVDDGRYRTREAWVERPVQRPRPPLMVAAQAPRALRATARYAGRLEHARRPAGLRRRRGPDCATPWSGPGSRSRCSMTRAPRSGATHRRSRARSSSTARISTRRSTRSRNSPGPTSHSGSASSYSAGLARLARSRPTNARASWSGSPPTSSQACAPSRSCRCR